MDESSTNYKDGVKIFTLAGISLRVKKNVSWKKIKLIIEKYFKNFNLPTNFKLHCKPLRHEKYPYNKLENTNRYQLTDEIFNLVNSDVALISYFKLGKSLL